MSLLIERSAAGAPGTHPIVLSRRRRELLLIGVAGFVPLIAALAISVSLPHPSFGLLAALVAAGIGITALLVSPRYPLTITVVALYLGLLSGPTKLGSGAHEAASVVRDVVIFAVAIGALMRIVVKRERIGLPPLSVWVFALCALVVAEAFNPHTASVLKALGGFRQQLEWVPFFFFGYALMRSKARLRRAFLLLGVLALANGLVSAYQARLSPAQLASWGPGYHELIYGFNGKGGRTFGGEGSPHVRPPGLGTDAGFGGGVGAMALPGLLALLASGTLRRRWPVLILCIGALLAVATGLGRLQAVGAVISITTFAALAFTAGRRVTRTLVVLLGVMVIAIPAGLLLVSISSPGTFSRYSTIGSSVQSGKDTKTTSFTHIPAQLEVAPFGVGLGTVGAAAGFGGKQSNLLEGHGVSAETNYNFIADELGVLGLVLWAALTVRLLTLIPSLRGVRDTELRLDLAALFSSFIAFTIMGFAGPTMSSPAFGPFLWFFLGTIGYWFFGPGRRSALAFGPARSDPIALQTPALA